MFVLRAARKIKIGSGFFSVAAAAGVPLSELRQGLLRGTGGSWAPALQGAGLIVWVVI